MTATRDMTVPRQRVWDMLADGWTYAQWVVGNNQIRAVDENWPEPGSTIHFAIGLWPLAVGDQTVVESCSPPTELVLLAKLTPLAAARIYLRLTDIPGGCRVQMEEVPAKGLALIIPAAVALAAVWPRNRECLARLAALAERRRPDQIS